MLRLDKILVPRFVGFCFVFFPPSQRVALIQLTMAEATPDVAAAQAPVAGASTTVATAVEKTEPQLPSHSSKSVMTDKLPSTEVLDAIYELDVVDKEKQAVKFRTLVQETQSRRNLVIFIRHFFCGVSMGAFLHIS